MSNFQVIDGTIGGGQAIDANSTTLNARLGQRIQAKDMASTDYGIGEFIYLQGLNATAVGSVVTFDSETFQTALAVGGAKGQVAFAMSACVTGEYGWYQIYGKCVGKVLALFADNAVPYLTATPGSLDDAVVAGDEVYAARSVSAIGTPAAGLALISVSYPFVTDASN